MTLVPEETIPPQAEPLVTVAPRPAWGYVEIILVLATFIASLFITGLVGGLLAKAFLGMPPEAMVRNPLFFAPVQLLAYLLTFAFMRLAVAAKSDQPFWPAIRWHLPKGELGFRFVLAGMALAVVVQVLSAFLPFPKSLPMQEYFRQPVFAYMMAAFGLLVAPIAEELFFRGLAYPVLRRSLGALGAIVITSAAFSLMHQGQLARAWAPLLVLFGVGAALTVIRERTDSVAASWITHVAYNGTLFLTLFLYSNGFQNLGR
jgi:uncharacterized protein